MTEYSNENRGAIWRNDRKRDERDPDFTGNLNVEGTEYFFDAWKRKPDANEKAPALSFRVKRKDKQPAAKDGSNDGWDESAAGGPAAGGPEDDIPFNRINARLQP